MNAANRTPSNLKIRGFGLSLRGACVVAIVAALIGALFVLGAPAATAQDEPDALRYSSVIFRSSCNADEHTFPTELVVFSGRSETRLKVCSPKGFYPVETQALCDQHVGVGQWIPEYRTCVTGFWLGFEVDLASCNYPLVRLEEDKFRGFGETANYCAAPLLSNVRPTPPAAISVTPVCIEDAIVQDDATAAELRVGDSFLSSTDGTSYTIVTGGSTCTFGCYDGFDVNCDGKIGDYCRAEIDRRSVAGAKTCLASINTSD